MVLTQLFLARKAAVLYALSILTSALLATHTFEGLFHVVTPSFVAQVTTSAMHLPYGGEMGLSATVSLEKMGASIKLLTHDPCDTGAHIVTCPVGESHEIKLISFRGCRFDLSSPKESLIDAWTNISFSTQSLRKYLADPDFDGWAHRGYVVRAESVIALLAEDLKTTKEKTIIPLFAGHSMGGGVAKLVAWALYKRGIISRPLVCTAGTPPILCPRAAKQFSKEFASAYIHAHDPKDPIVALNKDPLLRMFFGGFSHPEGLLIPAQSGKNETLYFAHSIENYTAALLSLAIQATSALRFVGKHRLESAVKHKYRAKL
ncbi:MAG: hypothetical protein H6849_02305 [Alphaproteobacteria bacterium]|nr:MAG: hypothetical protein H6849_02305 [Alphaproteobacteria bacterium]